MHWPSSEVLHLQELSVVPMLLFVLLSLSATPVPGSCMHLALYTAYIYASSNSVMEQMLWQPFEELRGFYIIS